MLVGGDREADSPGTLLYARSVEAFIAARRWDQACWNREPLVQAQAAVLDDNTLAVLRRRFHERPATQGWPGHTQYLSDLREALWSNDVAGDALLQQIRSGPQ